MQRVHDAIGSKVHYCDSYLIINNIINNEVFDFHPYLHLEKHVRGDNLITGNMTLSHDRGA